MLARYTVDAELWRRISQVFHAAMARDRAERAGFVAEACADDGLLRQEVEALLEISSVELELSDRMRAIVREAVRHEPEARSAFVQTACRDDTALLAEVTDFLALAHEGPANGSERNTDAPTRMPSPREVRRASYAPSGDEAEFRGNDRFLLQRRIGSGGFGVVYEARDLNKGTIVALKTLQNVTSESLYRFKREFRSLVGVSHRNLVQLYELASHENHWFFTMELIDGCHFLDHVSGRGAGRSAPAASQSRIMPASIERLLPAMRQLVEGLSALHRSGHVHRDVKPSNVLVDSESRVVLLDFGLVLDPHRDESLQSAVIAGTPVFMSPEQAAGLPLTPASDWYSVGVMLFQALTGAVPFPGTYLQILTDKQRSIPPSPSSIVEGIPSHLERLCLDLLDRDPTERPSEEEILERLSAVEPFAAESPRTRSRPRAAAHPFVGRRRDLNLLSDAFEQVRLGMPALALVSGPSGIGKSALVKAFLDRIRSDAPDTVILSSRCYERESVPYKALDSLIDSLARYLRRLPTHEMRILLPRELDSIAQLFPVMGDLAVHAPRRIAIPRDVQEVRRRACTALRDLLARLGDAHPVVLVIDDLQWGDVDSATLLGDVTRPPDAPALLLVAVYRDVEIQTSPFLRSFLHDRATRDLSLVRIRVDPLSPGESRELAAALASRVATRQDISAIAAESGGSPFFIGELVRFAAAAESVSSDLSISLAMTDSNQWEATLAHVIQMRTSRLPEAAQRLLQIVAVNGRPMPEQILQSMAGPGVGDTEGALALLRSEHLVRARETDRGVEFESYHDRIREIVVSALEAGELRECHRQLAGAWEKTTVADAELLAEHCLGAGDVVRAAHYTGLAAQEAEGALAFDRAARLYERALELLHPASGERASMMAKFALTLANAGRSVEAAAVYLAVPTSTPSDALDFKQKAAQQLLFAGHLEEGLQVVRKVLSTIGMTLPETRWRTLVALIASRLRVRMRGLRYRERAANAITPELLMRVDACWSVAAGLSVLDPMRGAVFQARHLLLALQAGEIERVHRALCLEAGFAAARGSRAVPRVRRIRNMTAKLTERIGTPYARALHLMIGGVCDYLLGRWTPAAAALAEAERLLLNDCTGVTWELDTARLFGLWSLYYRGDVAAIAARFPVLLREADDRGDVYASTTIRGFHAHIVYLAAADSDAASRQTRDAIEKWSHASSDPVHQIYWELVASTAIALYEGRGLDAWMKLDRTWPALRRSFLMEFQVTLVITLDLRGRAALSAAGASRQSSGHEAFLRTALRCATAMERQRVEWASAMALMLRAGVHCCRGHDDLALTLFDRAHHQLLSVDMCLMAAVARRRHGELTGGDAGHAEMEASETWMAAQGIRNPAALARVFAPSSERT